ncbi:hypothetical protein R1T40_19230 [Tritonibacter scottomollicae]|uniref:Uncharacterized protein n=1 Tax=Tritonibacter scottomollicae TaxID=483013 RepID=A0ABZ0HEH9_TRISK|nr:hypothetical protein [Tritonibacter scottomollicae]WOI33044.1 hypothetical protein R1T40_19230 [Tritonibacter scottomollicae]
MTEITEERSPAEEYFDGQRQARTVNRASFKEDAGDFLFAHEAMVSAITLCLKRFGGKKWPDNLDKEAADKTAQVAQLSMHFMHGVDLCEIAIAEGLYGQAAALMRQQMEIIGAIDEVTDGKRVPKRTPNIGSLSKELKSQYGGLSELTHAAVPDYLHQLFTDVCGDLVGAAITPLYRQGLALFLYRLEIGLLLEFVGRQANALNAAYGEAFDDEESKLINLAIGAANMATEKLGPLPSDE